MSVYMHAHMHLFACLPCYISLRLSPPLVVLNAILPEYDVYSSAPCMATTTHADHMDDTTAASAYHTDPLRKNVTILIRGTPPFTPEVSSTAELLGMSETTFLILIFCAAAVGSILLVKCVRAAYRTYQIEKARRLEELRLLVAETKPGNSDIR